MTDSGRNYKIMKNYYRSENNLEGIEEQINIMHNRMWNGSKDMAKEILSFGRK